MRRWYWYPNPKEPLRQFESASDRRVVFQDWKHKLVDVPVPDGHFVIDGQLYAYGAALPLVQRCAGCGLPLDQFYVPHNQPQCVKTHRDEVRAPGRASKHGERHQAGMQSLRPKEMTAPAWCSADQ